MISKIKNNQKFDFFKTKFLNFLKKLKTNRYINLEICIIFLFSLFMVSPIIFNYFYGDDTTVHAANIAVRGLNFSNVFAKILPEIGNNLGYGMGLFYPILPHLLGGLILNCISVFGLGEYAALKIIKFFIVFCSGITMYVLAFKLFKDKRHGLIAALFYISSSYFFVDLFSRDALNESFVFIFIPLIFLGIYYLFLENNKLLFYLCFVLGYVGMMYSHLVMSVWFTIIFVIFLLLFIKDIFKKQNLFSLIVAAFLILILTAPFTVPLIEHMLNGGYVIFNTSLATLTWTLDLKQFFVQVVNITGNRNYLYVNFNIVVILLSLMSFLKLLSKKVPLYRKKFIVGFLLVGFVSIFLVCNDTIWCFIPKFLNNLQFPWRLCTFAVFGISLFAVESLDLFYGLFKKKFIPVASLFIIIILSANVYYNMQNIQTVRYLPYNINDGMGWSKEYLPIETAKNIKYFENRKDNVIKIKKSNADVKILKNDMPNMVFEVKNLKKTATLEIPRLYYLGYKIVDENSHQIEYYKNSNGFISIKINKNGKYYVSYPGTEAYQIAKIVCIYTIIICIIYLAVKTRKHHKNNSAEKH